MADRNILLVDLDASPRFNKGAMIHTIFARADSLGGPAIVMGDFITIGVMGGQQIASIGKVIQVEMSYLQFPAAAANSVILLAVVLMIVYGLTRVVDIRKEL